MTGGSFNLGSLIVRLGADSSGLAQGQAAMQRFGNEVVAQHNKITKSLDQLSNDFKRFGADATRALTIPLTITGFSAAKQFMNYETTLARIEGLTGTSAEQTKQWSAELRQMGVAMGKKPQELAEALYFIASSGVEASKAMDILNVHPG